MNSRQPSNIIITNAANMRRISCKSNTATKSKQVVIIGDTWSAQGLAQLGVQAGHNIIMVNPNKRSRYGPYIRERVKEFSKKKYIRPLDQEKFVSESMNRFKHAPSPYEFFKTADVVVEDKARDDKLNGIFRLNMKIHYLLYKRKLLKEWSSQSPSSAIFVFARPTLIDKLAVMSIISARRHSVIGINLYHPLPVLKLAEIITTIYGSACVSKKSTSAWLEEMGIASVEVIKSGDLQRHLYFLSSFLHMVENGSMTVRDADLVANLCFLVSRLSVARLSVANLLVWVMSKSPLKLVPIVTYFFMVSTRIFSKSSITPFEMADFIGLDKAKLLTDEIRMALLANGKTYKESQMLENLISKGKLGKKTGEGFYSYKD